MKNLSIKLFSVLVILLFCLSPLGAIDLGHGDNVTHVGNNSADFKEINESIKDNSSDVEIQSVNETADLNEEGNEIDIENISSNDSDSNQKLKYEDLGLHVSVGDTTYGKHPLMNIWADHKYFNNGKVNVSVSGENFSKDYQVIIYKGANKMEINEDLSPGEYIVTVTFKEDPSKGIYYNDVTVKDSFTVYKLKPNLDAHIDNINPEDNPVVKFTCSDDLEGNVTISSDYISKDYTIPVSKGSFECELDENFTPGTYDCNIYYCGDDTHNSSEFTCNFDVDRYDPNLNISIADIHEDEYPVVKIKTNESFNGNVMVYFRDDDGLYHGSRNVKVVDGVGELTFDKTFKPGEHSATAIFYANGRFRYSEKSTKFMVN